MIPCFIRRERNGMWVIQSLAGRMKHDCMIVNDTVKWVYDRMVGGMPLPELTAAFRERALALPRDGTAGAADGGARPAGETNGGGRPAAGDPHTDDERIRFDLYRILMAFRDRDIGDYAFADVAALLPPGRPLRGTTQVMPVCLLDETAAFVARALASAREVPGASGNGHGPRPADAAERVEAFYGFPAVEHLNPAYFEPEQILRRHLDQAEVYFVGLDAGGRVEACTAIQGLPQQPATLRLFFSAARADTPEQFEDRIGIHLARLCGLVQVTTLSAKIRFQWTTGEEPRATRHAVFDRVVADLGFRRSLVLPDEFAEGNALVAYDRTLF